MNFDHIPQGTGGPEYSFASESIDSYIGDYNEDVQDTGADDVPAADLIEESMPDPEPDPTISQRSAAATAEVLTLIADTLLPMFINLIAKQEDTTIFKASADERKELKRAFTEYAKVKGTDIPPGWTLIICIAMIYGTKVPSAMMLRKDKAEKKEIDNKKEHATTIDKDINGADS